MFYKCDIITGTELRETVAPALIGNKYWLLISIIALLGSVLVWKALCLIPWLSFLLGKNKKQYELIYDWVIELRAVKWLVKFKSAIQKSIKSICNALYSFLAVEDKILIICSLAIVILAIIPLYKQVLCVMMNCNLAFGACKVRKLFLNAIWWIM